MQAIGIVGAAPASDSCDLSRCLSATDILTVIETKPDVFWKPTTSRWPSLCLCLSRSVFCRIWPMNSTSRMSSSAIS
ncbi:hypothetical protein L596_025781 [Steinernema carpocapsae]|uniref:Uncharacterized protein n=1 Tax=Steinernema carpocapsae TaxID=34508 RepID=A0A4U5M8R9_STECR|nr:hypothetical protein L596_025781 [Steinernema carpocapsae]